MWHGMQHMKLHSYHKRQYVAHLVVPTKFHPWNGQQPPMFQFICWWHVFLSEPKKFGESSQRREGWKKMIFLSVFNWTPEINQGMTTILYQGDGFTELQRCLFWRGKFKWKGSASFGSLYNRMCRDDVTGDLSDRICDLLCWWQRTGSVSVSPLSLLNNQRTLTPANYPCVFQIVAICGICRPRVEASVASASWV
jgi:hypothetical protein